MFGKTFAAHAEELVSDVAGMLTSDDLRENITRSEFLDEARRVEPLAVAVASYELYPPSDRKALGSFSPVNLRKPAGEVLGKALRGNEGAGAQVHEAICAGLAAGYVVTAGAASSPCAPDRSLNDIWGFVAANFRSGLDQTMPVAKEVENLLHELGERMFMDALLEAGLLKRSGKRKLTWLGWVYGEGGALLRGAQSAHVPSEAITGLYTQVSMHWPLDAAPAAPGRT